MADAADETFEQAGSGASASYPKQCSALRKNEYVLIKNRPCKIVDLSTSKTGKHGHAKVHIVGTDLFTSKKLEDVCPSTHNMNVPHVSRIEYQLIDMDSDGFLTLMDDKNNIRDDLKVGDKDPELKKDIESKLKDGVPTMAAVLKAMDEEVIVSVKLGKE
ncbi:eukaryotic translation initiation factor 5A-like [Haliotis cracherodii]|uniref:eukaryotic translation initiation factor 5A-like n=1 Tax=Haliotis rufescens TaxID=6454 RepID=UPI001EB0A211|nr:eukaryotic translation initiation factor 5A-like [Haliotis rufescens]